MPFTEEDKIIIKHYRSEKGYGRTKLSEEFPNRGWTLGCLGILLKKFNATRSVQRKSRSGRPSRTSVMRIVKEDLQLQSFKN